MVSSGRRRSPRLSPVRVARRQTHKVSQNWRPPPFFTGAARQRVGAEVWGEGQVVAHYIAIIVPADNGDWRVLFPDLAGCEARGFNLDEARMAAVTALDKRLKEN